jgi:hypothetical protein
VVTGKAALAILHALLQGNGPTLMDARILYTAALIGSAPKLIPALQSCFEDFDTSMRELSIRCWAEPLS